MERSSAQGRSGLSEHVENLTTGLTILLTIVLSALVLAMLSTLGLVVFMLLPIAICKASGLLWAILYLTFAAGLPSAYVMGKEYRKWESRN